MVFVLGIVIVCFGPKAVGGFRISWILGSGVGCCSRPPPEHSLSLSFRSFCGAGMRDELHSCGGCGESWVAELGRDLSEQGRG